MNVGILIRKARTLFNILKFRLIEKKKFGVGYVHYRIGSDSLLICFSAFPPTDLRVYNNIKGFKDVGVDRLYIKDSWGYRGSYYLYENGQDYPYLKTSKFIEHILSKYKYRNIYTAGTSKGGVCAILYGLDFGAVHIFAGACQYRIGNWLNVPEHIEILSKMKGREDTMLFVEKLNSFMPEKVNSVGKINSTIHLVYSKREHTYEDHIIELVKDLRKNNIPVVEHECFFDNHNDVGYAFVPYVTNWFKFNHPA